MGRPRAFSGMADTAGSVARCVTAAMRSRCASSTSSWSVHRSSDTMRMGGRAGSLANAHACPNAAIAAPITRHRLEALRTIAHLLTWRLGPSPTDAVPVARRNRRGEGNKAPSIPQHFLIAGIAQIIHAGEELHRWVHP